MKKLITLLFISTITGCLFAGCGRKAPDPIEEESSITVQVDDATKEEENTVAESSFDANSIDTVIDNATKEAVEDIALPEETQVGAKDVATEEKPEMPATEKPIESSVKEGNKKIREETSKEEQPTIETETPKAELLPPVTESPKADPIPVTMDDIKVESLVQTNEQKTEETPSVTEPIDVTPEIKNETPVVQNDQPDNFQSDTKPSDVTYYGDENYVPGYQKADNYDDMVNSGLNVRPVEEIPRTENGDPDMSKMTQDERRAMGIHVIELNESMTQEDIDNAIREEAAIIENMEANGLSYYEKIQ